MIAINAIGKSRNKGSPNVAPKPIIPTDATACFSNAFVTATISSIHYRLSINRRAKRLSLHRIAASDALKLAA
jgi:hypothetical protein